MNACSCGEDHTADPRWEILSKIVAERGETIAIRVEGGCWNVPRIWIGLHGLKGSELAALAKRYGWHESG